MNKAYMVIAVLIAAIGYFASQPIQFGWFTIPSPLAQYSLLFYVAGAILFFLGWREKK